MISSGIDSIFISVRDMDESLAFYRDWVGMEVVAEQHLDPEKIRRLWNLAPEIQARAVFLKNEEQPTMLELIEFQPTSKRAIRQEARHWDYGFYDVGFMVKDLDKTYKGLIGKGFTFISPPIYYKPDWTTFDVKEAILIGPNDMPIAHIELLTSPKMDIKIAYGRLSHVAQMVEDMDKVIMFYRDILGLQLISDVPVSRGLVDDVLMLPTGTDVRLAFVRKENSQYAGVEFLVFSLKGKSLASAAKPPNLGLFMISFETDDLPGLMEQFKSEKVTILSGPVELEAGPHGNIKAITVEGPNQEMLEFFEK